LATELNQAQPASPGGEWKPPPIKIILPNIPQTFHCSIIGTCFSTSDLRKLLLKLNVPGAGSDTEHALHTKAVQLAGMAKEGKLLHKALDRQHRALLKQFKSVKGAAALKTLWREAVGKGQIPGAYWAILTHEDTDDELAQEVFGEVHMLSHLNGAASRAELRRLILLEHENAALTIKLERQQRHLNEAFRSRDETIRNLQALLAKQIADRSGTEHSGAASEQHALKATIAVLQKRLSKELSHREYLEQGFKCQSRELANLRRTTMELAGEKTALHRELEAIETHIDLLVAAEAQAASERHNLSNARLLYVGGRTHAIPKFRFVIEGLGADFLHHDGGIEHSCSLLPNLINRADVTLFPVDCVSHDAAAAVKRLCGQSNKRYVPLRSASLACLLSALTMLQMEIGGSTCRALNVENELSRLQV
jgi:Uncharacterized protein conserved in bacteria (DUF2325)